MSVVFVYMTACSEEEARIIGTKLVEQKLAACINILPSMTSLYMWDGETRTGDEVVMLAKTTAARFPDLEAYVAQNHSYDCPCIVALPVTAGHGPFLKWISDTVS